MVKSVELEISQVRNFVFGRYNLWVKEPKTREEKDEELTNKSLKAIFGYYGYNNYPLAGRRD
ncbi:hypothetical protein HYT23_01680 [Candidatus Pacearchaeota archaeon]|nr:hypothetical protein [Candidatus Pacearchaeota archaeon]